MNFHKFYLAAICLAVLTGTGRSQPLRFDRDGMALLDGKRTFMLGLYEYPTDDQRMKEVAEAGFRIIAVSQKDSATTVAKLDRLAKAGMGGWIPGNFDMSENSEKVGKQLAQMVRRYRNHPALLAWEVPDEALWNVTTLAWEYRKGKEIKTLRDLVAGVKDTMKRASLLQQVDKIRPLYFDAEYAAGQHLADSLVAALGGKTAGPQFDLTLTLQHTNKVANGLKKGYDLVKSIDPGRPVFMNHAPRNQLPRLTDFGKAADIIGCDIYPVPEYQIGHSDLADRSMSSVGAYTQRMQASAPGKPVWMVLQGFGWGDLWTFETLEKRKELRQPTLKESRFMAYDAIVNGARGICYWGTEIIARDSQLWKDLLVLARELTSLQPVLSAEDATLPLKVTLEENFNSCDRPVRVLAKISVQETVFLVVNENQNWNPVFYNLTGIPQLNGTWYTDILSGKRAKVENGTLRFPIIGQTVQVLRPEGR